MHADTALKRSQHVLCLMTEGPADKRSKSYTKKARRNTNSNSPARMDEAQSAPVNFQSIVPLAVHPLLSFAACVFFDVVHASVRRNCMPRNMFATPLCSVALADSKALESLITYPRTISPQNSTLHDASLSALIAVYVELILLVNLEAPTADLENTPWLMCSDSL